MYSKHPQILHKYNDTPDPKYILQKTYAPLN